MATINDLMGLGMPGPLATREGHNVAAITCAGTSSGTATSISASVAQLTAASSQTGAIFPSGMSLAKPFYINTVSTTSAVLYPPSGATINGASSLTLAQNKTAMVIRFSATILISVLTA